MVGRSAYARFQRAARDIRIRVSEATRKSLKITILAWPGFSIIEENFIQTWMSGIIPLT
jgi:hypothetical protein